MSVLKRILNAFSGGGGAAGPRMMPVTVKCARCGETITATINVANDPSVEYGETGSIESYHCRKLIQGKGRCFQTIEINLQFDAHKKLVGKEIQGGTFVEE